MTEQIIYRAERLGAALGGEMQKGVDGLENRITALTEQPDASRLYIAFSQCHPTFGPHSVFGQGGDIEPWESYLAEHRINCLEYARMYLLSSLLLADRSFYGEKVSKLIEVADTGELVTFLRYLYTLPEAGMFRFAAVEALRTNIVPVFDAISQRNPYPEAFFNEQQWNQMYLKAAFLGRDLTAIQGVESRANEGLSRIISDYAHERWAAGREIDPAIWRPVTPFLNEVLLSDMERLFQSSVPSENEAAALVCGASAQAEAASLLDRYPEWKAAFQKGTLSWDRLGSQSTIR